MTETASGQSSLLGPAAILSRLGDVTAVITSLVTGHPETSAQVPLVYEVQPGSLTLHNLEGTVILLFRYLSQDTPLTAAVPLTAVVSLVFRDAVAEPGRLW